MIIGFPRGDPAYAKGLQRKVNASGISSRVTIAGYQGPIGDVWQLIDIHAHAAIVDSLPNAILKGMSLGKPAVVTAVGGIPTMVQDDQTGLVVPSNDPHALADAIITILEQPQMARRLGQATHARYEQRYTPEIMARSLENLFVEICECTTPQRSFCEQMRNAGGYRCCAVPHDQKNSTCYVAETIKAFFFVEHRVFALPSPFRNTSSGQRRVEVSTQHVIGV